MLSKYSDYNQSKNDKISLSDLGVDFKSIPKMDPQTIFIKKNGVRTLFSKTRKPVDKELYEKFDIELLNYKWIYQEAKYLHKIIKIFGKYHNYKTQYAVEQYKIDLYFTDLKLAIECDENNHQYYEQDKEIERHHFIQEKLQCTIIRFNPDKIHFEFENVLEQIYDHIYFYNKTA